MTEEYTSILSHAAIGTNNFDGAVAFYDKALATLDCKRIMQHACFVIDVDGNKIKAAFWNEKFPGADR